MGLLSLKQMKRFTNAFNKDLDMNIKAHASRHPNEQVLFTDKKWVMTDNAYEGDTSEGLTGARLWHMCDSNRERYQSPYDTIKGKCWSCEDNVPEAIRTLWTLYNAEKMHWWLNTDSDMV